MRRLFLVISYTEDAFHKSHPRLARPCMYDVMPGYRPQEANGSLIEIASLLYALKDMR